MSEDNLDGCELDFSGEPPTTDIESLLIPKDEEEDEDDD